MLQGAAPRLGLRGAGGSGAEAGDASTLASVVLLEDTLPTSAKLEVAELSGSGSEAEPSGGAAPEEVVQAAGRGDGGGGGGGGAVGYPAPSPAQAAAGGSGIVIIRGPSAATFTVAPGSNSTSTSPGGEKIATFTVSGTLTVS